MPTQFKEGDRVQVVDREATAEDAKSGLFYDHFRGLTGSIQKVYPSGEAAVEIELDSLGEALAQRHNDVQEQMRNRWMDGLSEAERSRLSDQEKDFRLRYTVLVTTQDLAAPGKKAAAVTPPATSHETSAASSAPRPVRSVSEDVPRRPTSADYDAAEEAYLQSRQRNGSDE
jgi:hypothetical protein